MVWYGMVWYALPYREWLAGRSLTLPVFRAGVRGQLAVTLGCCTPGSGGGGGGCCGGGGGMRGHRGPSEGAGGGLGLTFSFVKLNSLRPISALWGTILARVCWGTRAAFLPGAPGGTRGPIQAHAGLWSCHTLLRSRSMLPFFVLILHLETVSEVHFRCNDSNWGDGGARAGGPPWPPKEVRVWRLDMGRGTGTGARDWSGRRALEAQEMDRAIPPPPSFGQQSSSRPVPAALGPPAQPLPMMCPVPQVQPRGQHSDQVLGRGGGGHPRHRGGEHLQPVGLEPCEGVHVPADAARRLQPGDIEGPGGLLLP